ncbi:hypothetical protein SAMN06297144_1545 [Sphingomonas guangdongensis]|uniref:Uncharacterized protein n=1 Tax=Sphingomonas guangdongensis TaxID=1141890 RepID=A0A285QWU8_9SPHN|nr:hypothetical protein [Sphingomonas guangdongensis]SOB86440.1 hypothetical protein SAMN06297144_1545 [Sphingomonas guangdongensis]
MSRFVAQLERRAAIVAAPGTRAARLAVRLEGGTLRHFDDLARVPVWRLHDSEAVARIALVAGLLHHRPAIDAELSGTRLAPLAHACGEALFDRACNGDPPPSDHCAAVSAGVPPLEALRATGHALLARTDDPPARALVARAAALVEAVVP